jgi:hypothetical protein
MQQSNSFGGGENCKSCGKRVYVLEKVLIESVGVKSIYHKGCFKCSICNSILTPETYNVIEGGLFCRVHGKQVAASSGSTGEGTTTKTVTNTRPASVSGNFSDVFLKLKTLFILKRYTI